MSKSRAEVNDYLFNDNGEYTGISAEYVIAHAVRQAQRGKQPSVAFRGELNPRAALDAAVAVHEKAEARKNDPTLRRIAAEVALGGYCYQSPIEAGHVWGRD